MQRRLKASDVFGSSQPVVGTKSPFAEAFPTIAKLQVEVTCRLDFWGAGETWDYDENSAGEFVNCQNSMCYNGGFSLGSILREMVHTGQTDWKGTKRCQGYEGSPKGRTEYRSCLTTFRIRVAIQYKDNRDNR